MPATHPTTTLLAALRQDCFYTARDLERETGLSRGVVRATVAQLVQAGHVSRVGKGVYARTYRGDR